MNRPEGACYGLEAIANWLLVQWVRKDMGMVCVIVCNPEVSAVLSRLSLVLELQVEMVH